MAWMQVFGECCGCKRIFSFNATYVPSLTINGVKEPVCRDCIERVNPIRVKNGLAPIIPHPEAYEPEEV